MIGWLRRKRRHAQTVRQNVKVGYDFTFGRSSVVWAPRELVIGDRVALGSNVRVEVDGRIGDHVLLANSCAIVGRSDHDAAQVGRSIRDARWVGDFPDALSRPTIIGSDVWIGFGAIVLSGVTIGDSTIIGAGALVARDVPPNSIVVGNPARVVGQRFESTNFIKHWEQLERSGVSRIVPD